MMYQNLTAHYCIEQVVYVWFILGHLNMFLYSKEPIIPFRIYRMYVKDHSVIY